MFLGNSFKYSKRKTVDANRSLLSGFHKIFCCLVINPQETRKSGVLARQFDRCSYYHQSMSTLHTAPCFGIWREEYMRSTGIRLSGRPVGCTVQPVHGEQAVGVWNGCQDQDPGSDAPPRALPSCKPRGPQAAERRKKKKKGVDGMHVHMRKRAAVTLAVRSPS